MVREDWLSIETAPKNGTVFDVWLGNASKEDLIFYCGDSKYKRSTNWQWKDGKFRPKMGLTMPVFVQPTHWRPLPPGPM